MLENRKEKRKQKIFLTLLPSLQMFDDIGLLKRVIRYNRFGTLYLIFSLKHSIPYSSQWISGRLCEIRKKVWFYSTSYLT